MAVQARLVINGTGLTPGFMVYVYRQAIHLNLNGLLRNLEDGKIGIICEGERESLEKFKRIIWTNDELTKVTDIKMDFSDANGCYDTFLIAHDLRYNDFQTPILRNESVSSG